MSSPPLVRLGDVLVERNDVVHPRDNPAGNAVFVGLEHIESHTGRRIGQVPVDMAALTGRKPRFRAGDLVYGYLRPYLNKLWVAEFDGLCSVDQYVFTVRPDMADPAYVAWFMRSPVFLSAASVDGISSQLPRIRREEVASVALPLPPVEDQQRIAAKLSAAMAEVARARAAAVERMGAAATLERAVLDEAFGDEQWAARPLGDIADVQGGVQKSQSRGSREYQRPYLTVRNVLQGNLDLTKVEMLEVSEGELKRLRLHHGDLLIVEGNGSPDQIGRNALYDIDDGREWVHQNHIIRVRVDRTLALPLFVSHYLNSSHGREQMVEKARSTSGLYTLGAGKVAMLSVPVPSVGVQNAVLSALGVARQHHDAVQTAARDQFAAIAILPARVLANAFAES